MNFFNYHITIIVLRTMHIKTKTKSLIFWYGNNWSDDLEVPYRSYEIVFL